MESQFFKILNSNKEEATIHRLNRLRKFAKLRQILELILLLCLISWSTPRLASLSRAAADHLLRFSNHLLNHHIVFLIGNAIIVLLVFLFRRNDDVHLSSDLYDDYVTHSSVSAEEKIVISPPLPPAEPDLTQSVIVVCAEEKIVIPQCDDVAAAIDTATRQIKRFQRTQSEKLKREIGVRERLQRSETMSCRKGGDGEREDMERLSSEEFRRTVDAFIDKHWSGKKTKQQQLQFEEREKYQLMKMAY